ncbi:MAG: hypothetical protein JW982_10430 [Spirochaetes bacterium]|nr:hypothetical protein [Spirochaetota bacterium]
MKKHFCGSMRDENGRLKIYKVAGMIAAGIAIAVIFAFLFAFLVQYLWNTVLVKIFSIKIITFWQAFGLIILAKILFGGFGKNSHHPHSRYKYKKIMMNDEFICDVDGNWDKYSEFWENKGKSAWKEYLEKNEE